MIQGVAEESNMASGMHVFYLTFSQRKQMRERERERDREGGEGESERGTERNFAFNGGIRRERGRERERENSLRVTRENSCGRYQIALLLLFSRETKRRDRSSVP